MGQGLLCLFIGEELGSGSVHAALCRDKRRAHRNVSHQRLLGGHRGRMGCVLKELLGSTAGGWEKKRITGCLLARARAGF